MSEKIKPVPHKHAAVIKAWADGAVIQYFSGVKRDWVDVDYNRPSWGNAEQYRVKPESADIDKYGAKAGDVWLINGERLLFTFVDEPAGIDCFSLASDTDGAFDWDWEEFKKGKLLFRVGEVNKL